MSNVNASHLNSTAQQQQQRRAATPQMSASLAACQVTPESEYILCKILFHDVVHKMYKLADEDTESNKSKVTSSHVIQNCCYG